MKNKKGFTLIELLAVIIILGVLMIIAIPSVTTYIQNSRKSAYVDTAVAYVDAVRNKVNEAAKIKFYATDTLYMIPVGHETANSCISVETGGQSPFSDQWHYAYVGVTYDGSGYNYYFIGEDGAAQGLPFLDQTTLAKEGTDKIYSQANKNDENTQPVVELLKELYAKNDKNTYDYYKTPATGQNPFVVTSGKKDFTKVATKAGTDSSLTITHVQVITAKNCTNVE